tara:strand:+ start:1312 stop:2523 length:1212 start_codon:yes stop_codon:yes gene_type:complete
MKITPLTSAQLLILSLLSWIGDAEAADQKPLKVFLLVGQSNMQGHARIHTFEHIGMDPSTAPLLREMQDADSNPLVCDDVWISYLSTNLLKEGQLTAGFGADDDKIGPEFTFGIRMHELLGEPILLIKTAWGGKSLHTDFRPPSAGPYQFTPAQLEGFEKKGKDVKTIQEEKKEATGHYYRLTVDHVKTVLADIAKIYPNYDSKAGYDLAGFVWFQGWNDMVDSGTYPAREQPGGYDNYSKVLGHFIHDVREELSAPELPFVIGVLGVNGPVEKYGSDRQRHKSTHQNFRSAMAAPASLPKFKNTVAAVLTENYWDMKLDELVTRNAKVKQAAKKIQSEESLKGKEAQAVLEELQKKEFSERELKAIEIGISNQAYHYLGSAKIMAGIGEGFAEAMAELQENR